jgi:hypothetical protein
MTQKIEGKIAKRLYHRPQLERVQLVSEEAVLTACKNPTAVGKGQLGCRSGSSACKGTWTGS